MTEVRIVFLWIFEALALQKFVLKVAFGNKPYIHWCVWMYILSCSPCVCVCSDGGSLLQLVCEGDFEAVLFSSAVQGLLGGAPEEGDSIEAYLERQVLSYLSDATEDQRSDRWGFRTYGFLSFFLTVLAETTQSF